MIRCGMIFLLHTFLLHMAGSFTAAGVPSSTCEGGACSDLEVSNLLQVPRGQEPRRVFLNADIGAGSVQVPWQLTVVGGSSPRSSYSSQPDLHLPTINCTTLVEDATLCKGCITNDIDDSQVLAWMLNLRLQKDRRIEVVGASYTFGNTDFASATHTLTHMLHTKQWFTHPKRGQIWKYAPKCSPEDNTWLTCPSEYTIDIPIGSSSKAVIDWVSPYRKYVNLPKGDIGMLAEDLDYVSTACINDVVEELARQLLSTTGKLDIVATGPATDLACLSRNYPWKGYLSNIGTVYFLGGRQWGQGLQICNGTSGQPGVKCKTGLSDFNVRKNPVAVEALLRSGLARDQLAFVPFELSSMWETSISVADILLNGSVAQCNSPSRQFLLGNTLLRAQWYERVLGFGRRVWPWDLILFYKVLEPSSIICRPGKAAMVWCESDPDHARFFAPGKGAGAQNTCAGHAVSLPGDAPGSMADEAGQLWLCGEGDNCTTPVVDQFDVTICDRWASDVARKDFMKELMHLAWY